MTTGRTGGPSRSRRGRKRRVNTALLTVLAAVVAASLLVALGAKALSVRATCNGQPAKVRKPAAQFDKLELAKYPVIVTTHAGLKRDDARVFKDWLPGEDAKWPVPRDLIVIDEMVKEIQQYAIDMQAVEDAKASEAAPQTDEAC